MPLTGSIVGAVLPADLAKLANLRHLTVLLAHAAYGATSTADTVLAHGAIGAGGAPFHADEPRALLLA